MILRHFRNEIGNDITLSVQKKRMGEAEGILISVTCPDSAEELHVTNAEAQELYRALGSTLGWKK